MGDPDFTYYRASESPQGVCHNPSFRNDATRWNGKNTGRKTKALSDKLAATMRPERRRKKNRITLTEAYRKDWLLKRESIVKSMLWVREFTSSTEADIFSEVCHLFDTGVGLCTKPDGRTWFTRDLDEWGYLLNKDECTIRRAIDRLCEKGFLYRERFKMKNHGVRLFVRPDMVKILAARTRHGAGEHGYNSAEDDRAADILHVALSDAGLYEDVMAEADAYLEDHGGRSADFNVYDAVAAVLRERSVEIEMGDFPLNDRPLDEGLRARLIVADRSIGRGRAASLLAQDKRRDRRKPSVPSWVPQLLDDETLTNEEVAPLETLLSTYEACKKSNDWEAEMEPLRDCAGKLNNLRCQRTKAVLAARPKRPKCVPVQKVLGSVKPRTYGESSGDSGETPESIHEVVNTPTPYGVEEVSSFTIVQKDTSSTSFRKEVVESVGRAASPALRHIDFVRLVEAVLILLRQTRERNAKHDLNCMCVIPSRLKEGGWVEIFGSADFDPFIDHHSRRGLFLIHIDHGCVWLTTTLDLTLPEEAGYKAAEAYLGRQVATTPATPA